MPAMVFSFAVHSMIAFYSWRLIQRRPVHFFRVRSAPLPHRIYWKAEEWRWWFTNTNLLSWPAFRTPIAVVRIIIVMCRPPLRWPLGRPDLFDGLFLDADRKSDRSTDRLCFLIFERRFSFSFSYRSNWSLRFFCFSSRRISRWIRYFLAESVRTWRNSSNNHFGFDRRIHD